MVLFNESQLNLTSPVPWELHKLIYICLIPTMTIGSLLSDHTSGKDKVEALTLKDQC